MKFNHGKPANIILRNKIKYNIELNVDELCKFQNMIKQKNIIELTTIVDLSSIFYFKSLYTRLLDLNDFILELCYHKIA